MGFSGYPQPPTPPSVETETTIELPDGTVLGPGALALVNGVGMNARASELVPGGIILDAPAVAPEAPGGLFIPDLSTMPAVSLVMPDESRYLTIAEAIILGTTPGAASAADHYKIRVAGSVSGSQDVQIIGAGREHYWSGWDVITAGDQTGATASTPGARAAVGYFEATADAVVTAAGTLNYSLASKAVGVLPRRFVLMPGDRSEYLAVTAWDATDIPLATWFDLPFLNSVELANGEIYAIGIEMQAAAGRLFRTSAAAGAVYSGAVGDPGLVTDVQYIADAEPGSSLLAGSGNDLSDDDGAFTFRLSGSPGGVLIDGTVDLSIVVVGAPPAIPTDVNLRLQWAAAA